MALEKLVRDTEVQDTREGGLKIHQEKNRGRDSKIVQILGKLHLFV